MAICAMILLSTNFAAAQADAPSEEKRFLLRPKAIDVTFPTVIDGSCFASATVTWKTPLGKLSAKLDKGVVERYDVTCTSVNGLETASTSTDTTSALVGPLATDDEFICTVSTIGPSDITLGSAASDPFVTTLPDNCLPAPIENTAIVLTGQIVLNVGDGACELLSPEDLDAISNAFCATLEAQITSVPPNQVDCEAISVCIPGSAGRRRLLSMRELLQTSDDTVEINYTLVVIATDGEEESAALAEVETVSEEQTTDPETFYEETLGELETIIPNAVIDTVTTDPIQVVPATISVFTQPVAGQPQQRIVTWTAVTGSLPTLSYLVRCESIPFDSSASREVSVSSSTTSVVIGAGGTGSTAPLTLGKTYSCAVAASNAAGLGPFASSAPFEVPPPAPTGVTTFPVPGQPLHRTVEWIAPVPCNGCTFEIECTPTTGTKVTAKAASSPVTIGGFSSSETYTCRVRSTTLASGPGPWSLDSSEFTTAQLLERSTAVGYPIPPAGATTPAETLGFWRRDRRAPAVWNEAGISFEGKENVLQTGIVEADLQPTSFPNTQGRVYAYDSTVSAGDTWTISANVFIPQAFKDDVDPTDSTTWRRFSIWASLFNPINYNDQGFFAIGGYSNVPSDDTPTISDPVVNPQQYIHFWEWNPTVGTKTLSQDDYPVLYNEWNAFSAEVSVGATTEFKYYFNGKLAGTYSATTPSTTTTQLQVFIQTVNPCSGFSGIPATYCNKDTATNPGNNCCKGATYDVQWADIEAFLQ